MLPAHDEVTARWIVPLPALIVAINALLRFAIRITRLHSLDNETEFMADDTKKENDALLVDWGVGQTPEVHRRAELRPTSLSMTWQLDSTIHSRLRR